MSKFKYNEIVFVNTTFDDTEKFIVKNYFYSDVENVDCYVLMNIETEYVYVFAENFVFSSYEEAQNALKKEKEQLIKRYKEEIKTINDLLYFPLKIWNNEKYRQTEAHSAYKQRLYELTGNI